MAKRRREPPAQPDETQGTHERLVSTTAQVFAWCTTCAPKQFVLQDWEGRNFTPALGLPHTHVIHDGVPE